VGKDQTIHNPSDAPKNADIRIGSRGGMYYQYNNKTSSKSNPRKSGGGLRGETPYATVERAGVSIAFFKGDGGYRVRVSKTAPYSQECYKKIKDEYEKCGDLKQAIHKVQDVY